MKSKLGRRATIVFVLSAVLFLSFCVTSEAVTINGKSLGTIRDIVKETTGSDFPEIHKHSLLLYERVRNGNQMRYQSTIMTINPDGSVRKTFGGFVDHDSPYLPYDVSLSWVQKMDLAASNKAFGKRRNVIFTTAGLNIDGGEPDGMTGFQTYESDGQEDDTKITLPDRENPRWTWGERQMWGNANLTVEGFEDKDVFVIAHTSRMSQSGNAYLYFLTVDRNETGSVSSHRLDVVGGDTFFGHKLWDYAHGLRGVSIAAGDMNGDGYKNEIAVIFNDNASVVMYIYQVKKSGNKVQVTQFGKQDIHVGAEYGDDGYVQACPNAVVGDFDGDGEDEAAFVGRVFPNNHNHMRVGILDYNGGNWRYESAQFDVQPSATANSESPCVATRCDFDGDMKDEIAILFFQEPVAGTLYPRLERWYCDKGTITPKRDYAHKKGGAWDMSVFGYTVANTASYYKDIEEFSITAGPLTGTSGPARLAEDVAISHVNSDRSSVYVIPSELDSDGNFAGFGSTKTFVDNVNSSIGRRGGLITADFANEYLMLGDVSHTVNDCDTSWVTVIQALPYHVDNVQYNDPDNLAGNFINYTFSGFTGPEADGYMNVTYTKSSASGEGREVNFTTNTSTETISELGDVGPYVHGYLKFRATQANIAGNFDERIKAAGQVYQGIMDFVTTKINNTATKTTSSETKKAEAVSLSALTWDVTIAYKAQQHIWRYRILNDPLPSWYQLGPQADYTSTDLVPRDNPQHFLTFTLYDTRTQYGTTADKNNVYQARHEEGNFFSYPADLVQIEGYKDTGALGDQAWYTYSKGMPVTHTIKFTESNINKLKYDETTEPSELTKTISAGKSLINTVAGWFGFDEPFEEQKPIPDSTSNSDTFTTSFTKDEKIEVKFQGRSTLNSEAAGHQIMTMPFVAREGTLKVAHAVKLDDDPTIRNMSPLWGTNSRYRKYPDPSLVLPKKLKIWGANLNFQDNNPTAMLMRGLRFYMPQLDQYSDMAFLAGLTYEINVPIYNASFVDTDDFEIRLSYAVADEKKPNECFSTLKPETTMDRLHEIQTITTSLEAWPNNKGWAKFTWAIPSDFATGDYLFFVQIDPNHKLTEVHESRLDYDTGVLIDVGGNNEGYYVFNVTSKTDFDTKHKVRESIMAGSYKPEPSDGVIYNAMYANGQASGGNVRGAVDTPDRTGAITADVKLFDLETDEENVELLALLAMLADAFDVSPDATLQMLCTVSYEGDEYYPEVYLNGYNLKEGAYDTAAERGYPVTEEIESMFSTHRMALVPHSTVTFPLSVTPRAIDWENGCGFEFYVPELAVESVVAQIAESNKDSEDPDNPDPTPKPDEPDEPTNNPGSSSGGCNAGLGAMMLITLAGFMIRKDK